MLTRRQAIKAVCGAAACIGLGLWRQFAGMSAAGTMHAQTRPAMGTLVEIRLVGLSDAEAARAFAAAFARIKHVEKILTSHDNSGPLAVLSRGGVLKEPPPELAETLRAALEQARLSGGAFNPAVKPLLDLVRKNPNAAPAEIAAARRLADWRAIRMEPGAVYLDVPGMALTLDAIAKGRIVDYASRTLLELGVANHMINAGGDILARGAKPDGSLWKAGVADPETQDKFIAVLPLRDRAVATSNNSESRKEGYSHLIPPAEAMAALLPFSTTVAASSAGLADALATTLAVMPVAQGLEHIEKFNAACLLLSGCGTVLVSPGWQKTKNNI